MTDDKLIAAPIDWHAYFFNIVEAVSLRSKDPNTKVGAVVVAPDNKIVGVGYNGFPSKMKDLASRWNSSAKYNFVVHAEINAIYQSNQSVKGCKLYVPFWPCKDCAKQLAAAGISEIHVKSEYYKNPISETIFKECEIPVILHT